MDVVTAPRRLLLLGDTHANINWAYRAVQRAAHQDCDAILQLGDFAYANRHRTEFLASLDKALARHDQHVYWVDGNHDDHAALIGVPVNPATGFKDVTGRIHYIPRGHRWVWHGVRFLGLGGAYSIDADYRRQRGWFWSPEEAISYSQALRAAQGPQVDVMVTHDVPWGVTGCYGPETGGGNKDDWPQSVANRKMLRMVVDAAHPKVLVHGHVHHRYSERLRLEDGWTVQVEGYDCDTKPGSMDVMELAASEKAPADPRPTRVQHASNNRLESGVTICDLESGPK